MFDLEQIVGNNFNRVSVLQASISKSYYTVEAGLNTITVIEGVHTFDVNAPPGIYNRNNFASIFASTLNASSAAFGGGYTYSITFPNSFTTNDTLFYTYSVSGNAGVQPQFVISDSSVSNLYESMGFAPNTTYSFVGNSLVSIYATKLNPVDAIFIHSDICKNEYGTLSNNVLQEIYTGGVPATSAITYLATNADAYSKVLSSNKAGVFHFYITDQDDNQINLNGGTVELTLVLYKENDIYKVISNFIDMLVYKDHLSTVNM